MGLKQDKEAQARQGLESDAGRGAGMGLKQDKEAQAPQGFWRRAAYAVFVLLEVRANRFGGLEAMPREAQERPDGHK